MLAHFKPIEKSKGCLEDVKEKTKGCFKDVIQKSKGCVKDVIEKLEGCSKDVIEKSQGCVHIRNILEYDIRSRSSVEYKVNETYYDGVQKIELVAYIHIIYKYSC